MTIGAAPIELGHAVVAALECAGRNVPTSCRIEDRVAEADLVNEPGVSAFLILSCHLILSAFRIGSAVRKTNPNSSEGVCDDAAAVTDSLEDAAASTSVDPRISYVIARLERAVRAQINERLKPQGLTTLQYTTLSVLGSRGQPLSNAQLARRAYMTPQAMIEVLNALEHKGLIRRETHPNHRRVYPASLTDEGRTVLAACDASVEEMEEEMLVELDPAQRRLLAEWLKGCVRALHAGLPSDGTVSATSRRARVA